MVLGASSAEEEVGVGDDVSRLMTPLWRRDDLRELPVFCKDDELIYLVVNIVWSKIAKQERDAEKERSKTE
jgi:hypothetical protein